MADKNVKSKSIDSLVRSIREMKNPSALGLDTRLEYLPEEFAAKHIPGGGAAGAVYEFNALLLDGLRDAGVLPVALAYGTSETEALAVELGLPLLTKFRAQYERVGEPAASATPAPVAEAPKPSATVAKAARHFPLPARRWLVCGGGRRERTAWSSAASNVLRRSELFLLIRAAAAIVRCRPRRSGRPSRPWPRR